MTAEGGPARGWSIVAPVASVAEAEEALTAGADELYCGALLDAWHESFGDDELLTRRQGRSAHLSAEGEMRQVAARARAAGRPVALTLNGRYTRDQIGHVLDLVRVWENAGGTAVIVADPALLVTLDRGGSRLARHVSTLAGAFNPDAAKLFADLGATRLILPRDLTLREIAALVEEGPQLEYEALALYQRCEMIDGLCGFRHAVRLPDDAPCEFVYELHENDAGGVAVAYALDPDYEGHGCALPYECGDAAVLHVRRDDEHHPHCAACQIQWLTAAGVRFFKIAGRGLPGAWITRGVTFLRGVGASQVQTRHSYERTWGSACEGRRCYYAEGPA